MDSSGRVDCDARDRRTPIDPLGAPPCPSVETPERYLSENQARPGALRRVALWTCRSCCSSRRCCLFVPDREAWTGSRSCLAPPHSLSLFSFLLSLSATDLPLSDFGPCDRLRVGSPLLIASPRPSDYRLSSLLFPGPPSPLALISVLTNTTTSDLVTVLILCQSLPPEQSRLPTQSRIAPVPPWPSTEG